MKRKTLLITAGLALFIVKDSCAQDPISEIIRQAVTKVIKAVDLKIQRLQNKTIWLQNAQKNLENEMSKLKLSEISQWEEKQRALYSGYFEELWKIKDVLAGFSKIKDIISKEAQLVKEYKSAYALFSKDKNFSVTELGYMYKVYSGILAESEKNIDLLGLVINAFSTQMDDAKRIEIINGVSDKIDEQLADLRTFSNQNRLVSFQRAAAKGEIEEVRKLYGDH